MAAAIRQCHVPKRELCHRGAVALPNKWEFPMFRWAVICLVISLLAGGLGLANISGFAKKLSMIFFVLFLLGFLAFLGFAYLVAGAVSSSDLLPALVAVSV
jgi:uncharacterized membrane protein YtjA (UPF0391 family)